jgi:glycosyltransferase involved in cell wall biosynthesis
MRKPVPVSAFIICRNEAAVISDCIRSLDICQEIVVVDSGSTDGTIELIEDFAARGFPVRLIRRDWLGYAQQKQFALEQCSSDWCLNLDCDERLDETLKTALTSMVFDRPDTAGFAIPRTDYLPAYGYPPRTCDSSRRGTNSVFP